ncbi:MAG: hypothetical protein U0W40_11925 [Acidimicrobiia bacterium]
MRVDVTVEAHVEAVGERGGVDVGRTDVHQDRVTDVHGAAADLRLDRREARYAGDRALPAQELLHRGGNDRRILRDHPLVLGMLREEREEAGERVGDGVETGDEEQEADVEDLLAGELLAVDLGREEVREDVVGRRLLALVEDAVEERVDVLRGVALHLRVVLRGAALALRADDAVLHAQERGQLLPRQAHEAEEHRRRERHRELVGEVAVPPVGKGVEEPVEARGDVVLDRVHALRCEQRVEHFAVLRVVGRVDRQRDQRSHVAQRHAAAVRRREPLRVTERLVDRVARLDDHEAVHDLPRRALLEHGAVARLRRREVEELLERVGVRGRVDVRGAGLLFHGRSPFDAALSRSRRAP